MSGTIFILWSTFRFTTTPSIQPAPTSCSPVVKNVTPKEASGVIRFLTVKRNREDRGEGNFGSKKNESVVKVDHRRKKGRWWRREKVMTWETTIRKEEHAMNCGIQTMMRWDGHRLSGCWVTLSCEGMTVTSSTLETEFSSRSKEVSKRRLICGIMRGSVSCCWETPVWEFSLAPTPISSERES